MAMVRTQRDFRVRRYPPRTQGPGSLDCLAVVLSLYAGLLNAHALLWMFCCAEAASPYNVQHINMCRRPAQRVA